MKSFQIYIVANGFVVKPAEFDPSFLREDGDRFVFRTLEEVAVHLCSQFGLGMTEQPGTKKEEPPLS